MLEDFAWVNRIQSGHFDASSNGSMVVFDDEAGYLYGSAVQEEDAMIYETTYSNARAHLATLMDQVTDTREPILIRRRGAEPVALVAADELAGWMETAYLLRSPKNAQRLLDGNRRAAAGMRSSTRTACTTWSTGSAPTGGARFASSR